MGYYITFLVLCLKVDLKSSCLFSKKFTFQFFKLKYLWVLTPALSKPLPQRELREEPVSSVPVGPAVLLKTVLPVELWKNQTLIIYAIKYQKPIYP